MMPPCPVLMGPPANVPNIALRVAGGTRLWNCDRNCAKPPYRWPLTGSPYENQNPLLCLNDRRKRRRWLPRFFGFPS